MGYIMVTERRKGSPVVTWNISVREEGKAYPTRKAVYLGLLDSTGTRLVKGKGSFELTEEILEALERKNIGISSEKPRPRGRRPGASTRIPLSSLAQARLESVGVYRVLRGLAESCGLLPAVRKCFPKEWESVFALMCRRLDGRREGVPFREWAADTPFEEARQARFPGSAGILLSLLGLRRADLARGWHAACGSPARLVGYFTRCRIGAGRDAAPDTGEDAAPDRQEPDSRRIGIMTLFDGAAGLPVLCRAFPEDVDERSAIAGIDEEMKAIAPDVSILHVSERGALSYAAMRQLLDDGRDFAAEAEWDSRTLALLAAERERLAGPGEYAMLGTHPHRVEQRPFDLPGGQAPGTKGRLRSYVFHSCLESARLREELLSQALDCQEEAARYAFEDAAQAREWIGSRAGKAGECLQVAQSGQDIRVEIDGGRLEQASERFGFRVLLTTAAGMPASELLAACLDRAPADRLGRSLAEAVGDGVLPAGIEPAAQGRMLVAWGAAVLHRLLGQALERSGLGLGVPEALSTARKLRILRFGDNAVAQIPPRRCLDLVAALGLEREFPEFAAYLKTPSTPE